MAVGLKTIEKLLPIQGIKLASIASGIKKNNKKDLVIISLNANANCVASFTQNAFCAAPVIIAKQHIKHNAIRGLIINSGNANAGTGSIGLANSLQSCTHLAQFLDCKAEQILPFSTGVIGELLPMDSVMSGIDKAVTQLDDNNWLEAAQGIMTTDTLAKGLSKTVKINNTNITISAITKGSGMINPNMATLLAFIATDAKVDALYLQQCITEAVESSFNLITVDGDTSTNDACVLIATGIADNEIINAQSPAAARFKQAINSTCLQLAQSIVRDGEGATKFVTITVKQAKTKAEAKIVAKTVAHSPLVKTALFASDANWGRILAAVGRAEIELLNINAVCIYLNETCIIKNGEVDKHYTEEKGQAVMVKEEINIIIELGRGQQQLSVWTTDLSDGYIKINAEYRS